MRLSKFAAAIAVSAIVIQPVHAADLVDDRSATVPTTLFVGASVTMNLDDRRSRPSARLQVAMAPVAAPGRPVIRRGGLELGISDGEPRMYLAGQDAQMLRTRMGLGTTETVLLVGAGVLALLVVVAVASAPADLLDTCDDQPECL